MFSRGFPRALRKSAQRPSTQSNLQPNLFTPAAYQAYKPIWSRPRHNTTSAAAKSLFKEYPLSVSLASFFILFGAGTLVYSSYIYNKYIVGPFHTFPEPVAAKLRRALHYTNIELNPKEAVKYYRQALSVAEELGVDPFSDEILGIKIQLASFMEKIQQYPKAIDVLEIVRGDCLRWVEQLGGKEGNEGKRTRVMGKIVGISVKLGELYANDFVADRDLAEERLVWAVETVLKEQKRRDEEGVKEGEGNWMSNEEIGGALESLGNHYESKDQHYLAAPLYLQALSLIPQSSCHSIILMNNLSISLAQQLPPPTSAFPPPSHSALISSARAWATKSLTTASTIKAPSRTEECDLGCAVATHNLGEFAEMDGDLVEARRRYEEGRGLSKGIGFAEGVRNAEEGLRRLGKAR
ncbi:hypothetical protein MMC12_003879 [Toensbergia leucococca]|nr:hypothetical protein [Toensbergia leucococca]